MLAPYLSRRLMMRFGDGAFADLSRFGYEASSRVAQRALKENRPVAGVAPEEGLLTEEQLNKLLELEAMIRPTRRQRVATTL